MGIIRCRYAYSLNPVFPFSFLVDHGLIIGVATLGVHADGRAEIPAFFAVPGKGPGDQDKTVVPQRRRTMNIPDKTVLAAANHGPADGMVNNTRSVYHLETPSLCLIAFIDWQYSICFDLPFSILIRINQRKARIAVKSVYFNIGVRRALFNGVKVLFGPAPEFLAIEQYVLP
jgi:hypothetical protein